MRVLLAVCFTLAIVAAVAFVATLALATIRTPLVGLPIVTVLAALVAWPAADRWLTARRSGAPSRDRFARAAGVGGAAGVARPTAQVVARPTQATHTRPRRQLRSRPAARSEASVLSIPRRPR